MTDNNEVVMAKVHKIINDPENIVDEVLDGLVAISRGLLTREPPLHQSVDEHGLTADLVDREGNPIRPVFSTDEFGVVVPHCSECGAPLE